MRPHFKPQIIVFNLFPCLLWAHIRWPSLDQALIKPRSYALIASPVRVFCPTSSPSQSHERLNERSVRNAGLYIVDVINKTVCQVSHHLKQFIAQHTHVTQPLVSALISLPPSKRKTSVTHKIKLDDKSCIRYSGVLAAAVRRNYRTATPHCRGRHVLTLARKMCASCSVRTVAWLYGENDLCRSFRLKQLRADPDGTISQLKPYSSQPLLKHPDTIIPT